ncbi:MAG: zinc-ribbon domain-containing protein [Chloroflexota bacterium]
MVWAVGFLLTVGVAIFVGYPLFVREAAPEEDALEAAIAQRRGKKKGASARMSAPVGPAGRRGKVCAKCGSGNLPEDRFCARCGSTLGLRCATCGSEYDEGDLFCAKCGAKVVGRQA